MADQWLHAYAASGATTHPKLAKVVEFVVCLSWVPVVMWQCTEIDDHMQSLHHSEALAHKP